MASIVTSNIAVNVRTKILRFIALPHFALSLFFSTTAYRSKNTRFKRYLFLPLSFPLRETRIYHNAYKINTINTKRLISERL